MSTANTVWFYLTVLIWTLAWLGVLAAVGASVYFIAEVTAPLFN